MLPQQCGEDMWESQRLRLAKSRQSQERLGSTEAQQQECATDKIPHSADFSFAYYRIGRDCILDIKVEAKVDHVENSMASQCWC